MKMSPTHYAVLVERCAPFIPVYDELVIQGKANARVKLPEAYALWRIFHAAKMYEIYRYQEFNYLDTHIEAAMRKVVADHGICVKGVAS